MKIEIEIEDKISLVCCIIIGCVIGGLVVAITNNDALSEYRYKQYKTEHPSSTITYEDYKRLKG